MIKEKNLIEISGTSESERFRRIVRTIIRMVGVLVVVRLLVYVMPALRAQWSPEVASPSSSQMEITTCPDASSREIRGCTVDMMWSNWIKPEPEAIGEGLNLCYSPPSIAQHEYKVVGQNAFYRFRAQTGSVQISYKVVQGACPVTLSP